MSVLATYGYRTQGRAGSPGYQGKPANKPANDNIPRYRPPTWRPDTLPANDNPPARLPKGGSARFFRMFRGRAGFAVGAGAELAWQIAQFYGTPSGVVGEDVPNSAQYNRADCLQGSAPIWHYGPIVGRGNSCGTGALKSDTLVDPGSNNIVPEWHDSPTQPALAAVVRARWIRQTGSDPFWIAGNPYAYPEIWPYLSPFPSIAPQELPILQPVPQPQPVPWRWAPYPRPNPGRETGPRQLPRPRVHPRMNWRVNDGSQWAIEISPQGVKATTPAGRKPPPKGEKQDKFKLALRRGTPIAVAVGGATELLDFGQVMWDSLPKEFRSKGVGGREPNYPTKLRDIYTHINEVDWTSFWQNYAANEGEDRGWGHFGQLQGAANQNMKGQGAHFGPAL